MKYISVAEAAKKWNLSERSVRNYCAEGRIPEAFMTGKTWNVPGDAVKPARSNKRSEMPTDLLGILKAEKVAKVRGGIYHKVQIEFTYNSNHIEGSKLTQQQTRYIYETNTIGLSDSSVNVDDIVETANHFQCINLVIDHATNELSEKFVKLLHRTLKTGTGDSRLAWFAVGDYKRMPNEEGGSETAAPEEVPAKISKLIADYNSKQEKTLDDLLEFHYRFEHIHPFQDGNGRVGRLILLKECLKNGIVPFIIDDEIKTFYYRGLHEWKNEKGYLTDTCLAAQDKFKKNLDYFRIKY